MPHAPLTDLKMWVINDDFTLAVSQGATSHHLGQNFSKMFDIVFEDPDPAKQVSTHPCLLYIGS